MKSPELPLSNIQLELLKLFSRDMEDKDVIEIKRLIVKYLAKKLSIKANEVWEEKNWTNEDMENMLHSNLRKANK